MSSAEINVEDRGLGTAEGRPDLDQGMGRVGTFAFFGLLAAGLAFVAYSVSQDLAGAGVSGLATGAIMLLGIALLVALGFEFVNGFHDTANAVATVI